MARGACRLRRCRTGGAIGRRLGGSIFGRIGLVRLPGGVIPLPAKEYNLGLVGNVITLPLDVTGAILTGKTTHDGERQRVFDKAYAKCMSGDRVVLVPRE